MNVFTKEDGSRVHSYDIVKGDNSGDVMTRGLVGAGISLGNVVAGGLIAWAGVTLFAKIAGSQADDLVQVPFKVAEGLIEGTAGLIGSTIKSATSIFKDTEAAVETLDEEE